MVNSLICDLLEVAARFFFWPRSRFFELLGLDTSISPDWLITE